MKASSFRYGPGPVKMDYGQKLYSLFQCAHKLRCAMMRKYYLAPCNNSNTVCSDCIWACMLYIWRPCIQHQIALYLKLHNEFLEVYSLLHSIFCFDLHVLAIYHSTLQRILKRELYIWYVYVFSSKQYLRSIDTFIASPSLLNWLLYIVALYIAGCSWRYRVSMKVVSMYNPPDMWVYQHIAKCIRPTNKTRHKNCCCQRKLEVCIFWPCIH